jgi:hypothetical protein
MTIELDKNAPAPENKLDALKTEAKQLGISFHPSIGEIALQEKIDAVLNPKLPEETTTTSEVITGVDPELTTEEIIAGYQNSKLEGLSDGQKRSIAIKEANRLVRIRITCMNPNKKDSKGEIISVSNSVIGTFKKFIPFNLDAGYHVPHVIYQALKERMCQIWVNTPDCKSKRGQLIREFAIEVLDPLTEDELKELAQRQLMASGSAQV